MKLESLVIAVQNAAVNRSRAACTPQGAGSISCSPGASTIGVDPCGVRMQFYAICFFNRFAEKETVAASRSTKGNGSDG